MNLWCPRQTTNMDPLILSFSCKQPLPEFTLGPYSNPSKDELKRLCCIVLRKGIKIFERGKISLIRTNLRNAKLDGAKFCKTKMPWGELNDDCEE